MAGLFGIGRNAARAGSGAVELALDLTTEAITLHERAFSGGWKKFAAAELDDPEFSIVIGLLRTEAEARAGGQRPVRLWLPREQVLQRRVEIDATDEAARIEEAFRYVEAETVFRPTDVALAVAPARRDGKSTVLITFAETWREARIYAKRWGFQPGEVSTRHRAGDFGAEGPVFRLRSQPAVLPAGAPGLRRFVSLAGGAVATAAVAALVWAFWPAAESPEPDPAAPAETMASGGSGATGETTTLAAAPPAVAPTPVPKPAASPAASPAATAEPEPGQAAAPVPALVPTSTEPLPEPIVSPTAQMRRLPSEADLERAASLGAGQTAPGPQEGLAPVRVAPWGSQPEPPQPTAPSPGAIAPNQPDPATDESPAPITVPPGAPAAPAAPSGPAATELAALARQPEEPARRGTPLTLAPAPDTPPATIDQPTDYAEPAADWQTDLRQAPIPTPRPGLAAELARAENPIQPPPRPAHMTRTEEPAAPETAAAEAPSVAPTVAEAAARENPESAAAAVAAAEPAPVSVPAPADIAPADTAPAAPESPAAETIETAMSAPEPPAAAEDDTSTEFAVATAPQPPVRPATQWPDTAPAAPEPAAPADTAPPADTAATAWHPAGQPAAVVPPHEAVPSESPARTGVELAMVAPAAGPPDPPDPNAPTALAALTSPHPPVRPAHPVIRVSLPPATALPNVTRTPPPGSVTSAATDQGLPLDRTALIGILNLDGNRRALLRMPDGRYRSVVVGDVLDGWKVSSIGVDAMRISKGGTNRTLPLVSR